jgi:hypothetical protein
MYTVPITIASLAFHAAYNTADPRGKVALRIPVR